MSIYAFKGEVITCDNGHPYAQFRRDILQYEAVDADDLKFADGISPEKGEPYKPCKCGARVILTSALGGVQAFIAGKWRELP